MEVRKPRDVTLNPNRLYTTLQLWCKGSKYFHCYFSERWYLLHVMQQRTRCCRVVFRCSILWYRGAAHEAENYEKHEGQVSSIWGKECILMTVCVLSDLTWLPFLGGGRKSWYITYELCTTVRDASERLQIMLQRVRVWKLRIRSIQRRAILN